MLICFARTVFSNQEGVLQISHVADDGGMLRAVLLLYCGVRLGLLLFLLSSKISLNKQLLH